MHDPENTGNRRHGGPLHSLQVQVVLFSLALILTPTLVIGVSVYARSSQILQASVTESSLTALSQLASNVGFVLNEMRQVSLRLYQEPVLTDSLRDGGPSSPQELEQESLTVQKRLSAIVGSSDHVDGIQAIGANGKRVAWSNYRLEIDAAMIERARRLKGGGYFVVRHATLPTGTSNPRVYLIRQLNDVNNIARRLGVIVVETDERRLAEIYRYGFPIEHGDFVIIDRGGRIVSAIDRDRIGRPLQDEAVRAAVSNGRSGIDYVDTNLGPSAVAYHTEPLSGWRLVLVTPKEVFLRENAAVGRMMLAGTVAAFVMCLAISVLFYTRIVRPIKLLGALMGRVEQQEFVVSAPVAGYDEIAHLADSFNRMTRRIRSLVQEVYYGTIRRREAELKALQAQIHPHFLYNSLDAIYWLARTEGASETSEVVKALSMVFRLSLNQGDEFTTLGNEIELLQNYFVIQRARYGDSIVFSVDCPGELLDCRVIKLVLQPLVENAVQHGVERNGGAGKVAVTVRRESDRLVYQVEDDGAGADEAEVRALVSDTPPNVEWDVSQRGFGLRNVNERIRLHFGRDFGLEFSSAVGSGTTVIVAQPCLRWEESRVASDGC